MEKKVFTPAEVAEQVQAILLGSIDKVAGKAYLEEFFRVAKNYPYNRGICEKEGQRKRADTEKKWTELHSNSEILLSDFGVDSLQLAELTCKIEEKFGIRLNLEELSSDMSPADITLAAQKALFSDSRLVKPEPQPLTAEEFADLTRPPKKAHSR